MRRHTAKKTARRILALALAWSLMAQAVPFAAMAASTKEPVTTGQSTILQGELSGEQSLLPLTPVEESPSETAMPEQGELSPDAEMEESELVETAEPEPLSTEDSTQKEATDFKEAPMDDSQRLAKAAEGTLEITTAEQLLDGVPVGSTYLLGNDIVMGPDQQIGTVAGVLDGAGHTVTIEGKPLVRELTGTIQNLLVDGKAELQNGEGSIVCTINGGTLQNCASTVDIDPGWAFNPPGGLAGNVMNGRIYNSYFAGTGKDFMGITSINGILYQSSDPNAPSQVKNCYYSAGLDVGSGSAWNRDDASNGKKSLEEMKTPEFVQLLNATTVGSGYVWAVQEGNLPKLIVGGGTLEPCNKDALNAVIQEAESKNESDYTNKSWQQMQKALQQAKKVFEQIDAIQSDVDAAEQLLRDAIAALEEKVRNLSPVEPPQNGVIAISSQQDLGKIDGSNSKLYYQLTQDIVVQEGFSPPDLAGVLDGNGHTITICAPVPLFNTILQTGVVQNLSVKVKGNFTNRQEYAPFAENLKGGLIVNCISEVTGQHSAGYVWRMEDGALANCLTMGHNRRGAFVYFQKSTDHQNSNGYKKGKFYNCYWAASNSVENITPIENLVACAAVGDEELRSEEFINRLNAQKGEFGFRWGRDVNGYPSFGDDHGDLIIDGSNNRYPVQFVWHDDQVLNVEKGSLMLSPQMTNDMRFAGRFQLIGVPKDSTILWSCEDRTDQQIMQMAENGDLFVFHDGGGIVRAVERKSDGTQELAAEIRVVSASKEIEEMRLLLDGKVIQDTATVQGSAVKELLIEVKYVGAKEFQPLPAYLVELISEKPDLLHTDYNVASFYFKEPGTSKLTVTEKTQKKDPISVTVNITSEYVPVQKVHPAIGNTIEIHYRNSMGSGQFISLPQTVFVEPFNASYKSDVVVKSSDPSIAEYDGSGYIPHKNGTVTFTAQLNDQGNIVQGKSTVNFVYANPLSNVSISDKSLTLEQASTQFLPLSFQGQPGNRHEVTEPDMIWTFDKPGIVSIQRPNPLVQIRETGGPDDGNWVASTQFEVKARKPGTVLVTGTPVDTTGGAAPIQFKITVKGDDSTEQIFDIPNFIATGKKTAADYLKKNNAYRFGEEWAIFTLLRDGQTLQQQKLDRYYEDVVTNVQSWKDSILATEIERTAIVLNIMGKDIANVGGVNLVERLCNHPDLTKQGSNSLSWALLALDMKDTAVPANMKWSRERLVQELLTYQNQDGGFGLSHSGASGIDITAMSLQALARYQNQKEVATAIEKGVAYLAAATQKNYNLGSSESIAQVIITLAVLNRDIVKEPGFGDEMDNIMSALSEYFVDGEGVRHDKNGRVDKMATTQALQALCAYERFLNGESSYWDLRDPSVIENSADAVIQMIEEIPQTITVANADIIKAARAAYNALPDTEKAKVKNLYKLRKAEKALEDALAVQAVEDAINALPDPITQADEDAVKAARTAYNQLSLELKKRVTNLDKLIQAEKALKALRKPPRKPGWIIETESNVIEFKAENGVIPAQQLEKIQGKELILRVDGTMESGERYVVSIYGKDVIKAKDFTVEMKRQGLYETQIQKLAEQPEIFRFVQTGLFPAPIMVQMDTSLADGDYLLLHYDPAEQRASLVSRVKASNGKVQFVVEQGGEYFFAKKASKKSIPELDEAEKLAAPMETMQPPVEQTTNQVLPAVEETSPVQPEKKTAPIVWAFVPLLLVAGGGGIIVLKKRKENHGE